jgi:hypothetical protein
MLLGMGSVCYTGVRMNNYHNRFSKAVLSSTCNMKANYKNKMAALV